MLSRAIITAQRYLLQRICGKTGENRHPWRRSREYDYFHSRHVDAICQKVLASEAPEIAAQPTRWVFGLLKVDTSAPPQRGCLKSGD